MAKFNELPPQELWSARIDFFIDQERFSAVLRKTAEQTDFTFFGFFVFDETNGQATAYHFTRYPQQKYQTRNQEECERALVELQQNFSAAGIPVLAEVEPPAGYNPNQYRIILGLREGYDPDQPIKHTLTEARKFLRPDCVIKPAEMFAVGPERNYREPALMILGQEHHLKDIYELAAVFNQERFILENFAENSTRVVELAAYG